MTDYQRRIAIEKVVVKELQNRIDFFVKESQNWDDEKVVKEYNYLKGYINALEDMEVISTAMCILLLDDLEREAK